MPPFFILQQNDFLFLMNLILWAFKSRKRQAKLNRCVWLDGVLNDQTIFTCQYLQITECFNRDAGPKSVHDPRFHLRAQSRLAHPEHLELAFFLVLYQREVY